MPNRIAARDIRAGHEIIRSGCVYRAIGNAEPYGPGMVTIPTRVVRGNGSAYRVSRPNVSLTLAALEPVDIR